MARSAATKLHKKKPARLRRARTHHAPRRILHRPLRRSLFSSVRFFFFIGIPEVTRNQPMSTSSGAFSHDAHREASKHARPQACIVLATSLCRLPRHAIALAAMLFWAKAWGRMRPLPRCEHVNAHCIIQLVDHPSAGYHVRVLSQGCV